MTYDEAVRETETLRENFDRAFNDREKKVVARLYSEVLGRTFTPTSCQQCYHDALIEIYLHLKQEKTMAKKCNYRLRAGFIISCPDFRNGKIFTNDNLTDSVAKEYLAKYPKMEKMFQTLPESGESEEGGETQGKK